MQYLTLHANIRSRLKTIITAPVTSKTTNSLSDQWIAEGIETRTDEEVPDLAPLRSKQQGANYITITTKNGNK